MIAVQLGRDWCRHHGLKLWNAEPNGAALIRAHPGIVLAFTNMPKVRTFLKVPPDVIDGLSWVMTLADAENRLLAAIVEHGPMCDAIPSEVLAEITADALEGRAWRKIPSELGWVNL